MTLWYARSGLAGGFEKGRSDERVAGMNIVRKALEAPARQILENAGLDSSDILSEFPVSGDGKKGYDARKGEVEADMFKAGIVDPAKVVRIALQNAASIAGMLLTTECMVADEPEKERDHGSSVPGGMGGMGF